MRWGAFFLGLLLAVGACVVEDKPVVDSGVDGGGGTGGDGGCEGCPDETPVCLAGTCVQCTPDDEAYCTERSQVCGDMNLCIDCVAEDGCCLSDDDCTERTASRCDLETNTCDVCETNAQCDGVEGLSPEGNACDDGLCVDCTPDSEAETCANDKSCNPDTNTCTNTTVGSLTVCEACVADSECGDAGAPSDAFRCVPMFYPDAQTRFPDAETGFCLEIFAPGGCEQPYAIRISDRPSLSDDQARSYCGINESLTTCPAVRALDANQTCQSGENADCPEGGVCGDVGGLADRCTYLCSDETECDEPPNPGSTCGTSGSGDGPRCGG